MTSYLNKNEVETYKMAMSILPKFLTLKWNISRTIWHIEVVDASFFFISHALSFELNFEVDQNKTVKNNLSQVMGQTIKAFCYQW